MNTKLCDRCGGEGEYMSDIDFFTGKVSYESCSKCYGTGSIPVGIPADKPLSYIDRERMLKQFAEENLRKNIENHFIGNKSG